MLYQLEQAPYEKKLITIAIRNGQPIPKRFLEAPELDFGLDLYWEAFWELHSCRWYEGGPIPFLVTEQYARMFEFDEDQKASLFELISFMDGIYREWLGEQTRKSWRQAEVSKSSPKGWGSSRSS